MRIKAQAMIHLSLLADGLVEVTVWHGEYFRENKPEDYTLVDSFTCPVAKFQAIGILMPNTDAS